MGASVGGARSVRDRRNAECGSRGHPGERRGPLPAVALRHRWIPAFAEMTASLCLQRRCGLEQLAHTRAAAAEREDGPRQRVEEFSELRDLLRRLVAPGHRQEGVLQAGGLIRWPAVLTLPVGFGLVILQGISEIIKRIGWLMNVYDMDIHYERPLQ